MKNKILPRLLIGLVAATLISTMLVSSLFAKYITSSEEGPRASVTPAAFNVEFYGFELDKINVNFARDGLPVAPLGYSTETVRMPFRVKSGPESQVAADVTLEISFAPRFEELLAKDKFDNGVSCEWSIVDKNGDVVEFENGKSKNSVRLGKGELLEYILIIDVHNAILDLTVSADDYKFITDAISLTVTAKSVNPVEA